jgi:hypothetical protein
MFASQEWVNLQCPFQCDECHFRNIKQREPRSINLMENYLLRCIHHENMDAFWVRWPITVESNLATMHRIVQVHENVHGINKGSLFQPQGPYMDETFGAMTVVALLGNSLNAGVNETTVQFNTIRKQGLRFQITREPLPRKTGRWHWWDVTREENGFHQQFHVLGMVWQIRRGFHLWR